MLLIVNLVNLVLNVLLAPINSSTKRDLVLAHALPVLMEILVIRIVMYVTNLVQNVQDQRFLIVLPVFLDIICQNLLV